MSNVVIKAENVSKLYRLGLVGSRTLSDDLSRWWARVRGKEDPTLKIGEVNTRDKKSDSNYIWALKDINFEVKRGEVLGIIGKNGAGKSTLLKILSQVTEPTTGKIGVKGRIASLLEVGTGFHPELTGRENIFLNGAILGMTKSEIRSKLNEIIEFAGVERYVDTPVKRYSSGMKVRLGFAVAAHLEPEILVVDEVLAVGDLEFQKKCIGKMKDVAGEGRTVLFVSHNMASITGLCQRAIMLEDGKVVKDDEVNNVVDHYVQMQSQNVDKELEKRTDRKGTGLLKFTNIYFTSDQNATYGDTLVCGKPGYIVMEVEKKRGAQIKNASFAIIIKDKRDNHIATLHTRFKNAIYKDLPEKSKVICKIDKVPFIPSKYFVTIRNLINGQSGKSGEVGDHVDVAAEFMVMEYDYFNTGELPNAAKHGTFVIDHEWEFKQAT